MLISQNDNFGIKLWRERQFATASEILCPCIAISVLGLFLFFPFWFCVGIKDAR